ILSAIWPSNLDATLFPRLRCLSLNLEGVFPGDSAEVAVAECVIGRLESRSHSGAPLELLNIDFGSERIIKRLKDVVNSVVKGKFLGVFSQTTFLSHTEVDRGEGTSSKSARQK